MSRGLRVLCEVIATKPTNGHSAAFTELSALLFSKFTELTTANCRWEPVAECPRSIFTRHDLPAMWDFAEGVPTSSASGSFDQTLQNMLETLSQIGADWRPGQVQQADARRWTMPNESAAIWFTDPPYYDAIAYADLSDFFFVWLKRALPRNALLRDTFDPENQLVPKRQELTVTTTAGETEAPKTCDDFERGVADSFAQGVRISRKDGIGCIVFAHKTTEGWESLLRGMLTGGWVVVASWPVATEMGHRFNARDIAALATSVHLICRPRPDDAPVGDWGEVLRELPKRVGDWMERLQGEGIRGADLVFACIGPALEIFSRYRKVETAEGHEVKLAEYLEKVWEVVGRTALENVLGSAEAKARNGAAGALEEDARLTALFLWTLQSTEQGKNGKTDPSCDHKEADCSDISDGEESEPEEDEVAGRMPAVQAKTGGFSLAFDVARRFAQPLGVDLSKWEGRIIETSKGVVRLMAVGERAKQLFGEEGAAAVGSWLEEDGGKNLQQALFPEMEKKRTKKAPANRGRIVTDRSDLEIKTEHAATTLDRIHAAMLLQAGGQTNGLRALIKAEQERGTDFLRLANALSALYPSDSEEKRLLDAMLLAAPR